MPQTITNPEILELLIKNRDELKAIKNFGAKSLDEIIEKLQGMGLSLGMKTK